ncbi:somatomedin-B and thrombospondin type-1 domain-containing protein isoform X2 [Callorhinchus milii]|uniref:RPE-spondin-like protein n=1 Tax=Callorhinchus milii TaxID=7868 RepID=V9KV95_CALMI|nr:somatomedin-B and thrombospondin type-1 domain-containing protein isoform X2 [Callorhinchus milii]|eukprot:gi/632940161/ref/XP_007885169.1/ PREDICTED: somatomedin-B and thrombospondin type-1 domain-containing protein [Callorhinchus milii]
MGDAGQWLLLAGLLWLSELTDGGCSESGKCCKGRDHGCGGPGWRADRVYGTCYCDEACQSTGDCCYDYTRTCPARPCVVSEWSHWSGCAEQCQPNVRVRRRYIEQEPQNHGDPCPALEERAGCLEYMNYQGIHCGLSHVPAFISTAEYNKERRKRALVEESEISEYCTEFKLESLSFHCTVENRPFARWMQYLREGYTVCVACQPPAMNTGSHRCIGDGAEDYGTDTFQWQAVGNNRCRGTWKKVRQVPQCSCPVVHSFVFT